MVLASQVSVTSGHNIASQQKESKMDQSASRGASSSSAAPLAREPSSARSDFDNLRNDFNGLKDTVTKFISQATDQASKSMREASTAVAGQVTDAAVGLKESGSQLATAATEQAKTFATELENMGRR